MAPATAKQKVLEAVQQLPSDATVEDAVEGEEISGHKNFLIAKIVGRDRQGPNGVVRAGTDIEAQVQGAVGIKPGDPVAVDVVEHREATGDDHFPVRLQGGAPDRAVRAIAGIKRGVE